MFCAGIRDGNVRENRNISLRQPRSGTGGDSTDFKTCGVSAPKLHLTAFPFSVLIEHHPIFPQKAILEESRLAFDGEKPYAKCNAQNPLPRKHMHRISKTRPSKIGAVYVGGGVGSEVRTKAICLFEWLPIKNNDLIFRSTKLRAEPRWKGTVWLPRSR